MDYCDGRSCIGALYAITFWIMKYGGLKLNNRKGQMIILLFGLLVLVIKFIQYPQSMHKTHCPSTRRIDRSMYNSSSQTTPYTNKSQQKSSTSTKKKQKNYKPTPQITDWAQLLQEISNVTHKVQKLCKKDSIESGGGGGGKAQVCRSRAQMKNNYKGRNAQINENQKIDKSMLCCESSGDHRPIIVQPESGRDYCNPDCHFLMYECMKLNNQRNKLLQEKQQLEKRLYFQSKEKRQLRWKLQKQHQKQKQLQQLLAFRQDLLKNNSFTLKLSKASKIEGQINYGLSQSSYLTAKRTSPLKQLSSNLLKNKENKDNDEDSLLIDISVRDSNFNKSKNVSRKSSNSQKSQEKFTKAIKYISCEKDLHQLLEICKNQPDPDRKKVLRKQMKQLAQQIKTLKSQTNVNIY